MFESLEEKWREYSKKSHGTVVNTFMSGPGYYEVNSVLNLLVKLGILVEKKNYVCSLNRDIENTYLFCLSIKYLPYLLSGEDYYFQDISVVEYFTLKFDKRYTDTFGKLLVETNIDDYREVEFKIEKLANSLIKSGCFFGELLEFFDKFSERLFDSNDHREQMSTKTIANITREILREINPELEEKYNETIGGIISYSEVEMKIDEFTRKNSIIFGKSLKKKLIRELYEYVNAKALKAEFLENPDFYISLVLSDILNVPFSRLAFESWIEYRIKEIEFKKRALEFELNRTIGTGKINIVVSRIVEFYTDLVFILFVLLGRYYLRKWKSVGHYSLLHLKKFKREGMRERMFYDVILELNIDLNDLQETLRAVNIIAMNIEDKETIHEVYEQLFGNKERILHGLDLLLNICNTLYRRLKDKKLPIFYCE